MCVCVCVCVCMCVKELWFFRRMDVEWLNFWLFIWVKMILQSHHEYNSMSSPSHPTPFLCVQMGLLKGVSKSIKNWVLLFLLLWDAITSYSRCDQVKDGPSEVTEILVSILVHTLLVARTIDWFFIALREILLTYLMTHLSQNNDHTPLTTAHNFFTWKRITRQQESTAKQCFNRRTQPISQHILSTHSL